MQSIIISEQRTPSVLRGCPLLRLLVQYLMKTLGIPESYWFNCIGRILQGGF